MGLKNSKCHYHDYYCNSFHLISAKLYESIGYCGGIQAIIFLATSQVVTFYGPLKF